MKIKAEYLSFIREIKLDDLYRFDNNIDLLISNIYTNCSQYKLVYLFQDNSCLTPLCEIKIKSFFVNCIKVYVKFIGDKKSNLTFTNFSFSPKYNIDSIQEKQQQKIDVNSIDIKFQQFRDFISTFFGKSFSYCFIYNDPTKAKQIAVSNLKISGTKIPLTKPICFRRDINYKGIYSFPDNKDIRQLIEYGFIVELVQPFEYYQGNSIYAYPVYQIACNIDKMNNYENNLQLLNNLSKQENMDGYMQSNFE